MKKNLSIIVLQGNVERGTVRGKTINLSEAKSSIVAHELFECSLTGDLKSNLRFNSPNLISCHLQNITFQKGLNEFDAKNSIFNEVIIYNRCSSALIMDSILKNTLFEKTSFRNTVLIDCKLYNVSFINCDLSILSLKDTYLEGCSFVNCKTTNKLFEHCVILDCKFTKTKLQHFSILQNFGLRKSDLDTDCVYSPEVGKEISIKSIVPVTTIEDLTLEYFNEKNINESENLFELVNLNFKGMNSSNILHHLTGLYQLCLFLDALCRRNELITYFPLQLFWAIDNQLGIESRRKIPLGLIEKLELCYVILRKYHEKILAGIPKKTRMKVLVREGYRRSDIVNLGIALGIDLVPISFKKYNSPSIAEFVFKDIGDYILIMSLILSTNFLIEIDKYNPTTSILEFETKLIGKKSKLSNLEYKTCIILNVPKVLYLKINARLSLKIINKIKNIFLTILRDDNRRLGNDSRGNG